MPILGSEGDVMGAFDFYSAEVRWPTIQDLEVLKIVTSTASVIIERDRHLRRLIDSEEQRREVEQIAQLGYWSASLETFESSISAIAKAICGLPSDQEVVTLQELREMVHPDDLSRVVSEQRTALKAQAPVRSNFRIVHADKSIHHVDMQGNIQFDIDGKAVRYVGTVQDTTEQRLREAALRLYQRAIDSSSNGVVVVNGQSPEMEIIYINRAFEAMTGYALEEVVGRNCRFLQGEAVDQPGRAALRQAIADRTDGSAVLRNFRKDGSEFWVEVRVSPVKDDSGNVTHYVGFQTEISERIRYERELLYQGTHDALTGLPNRALAIEHLDLSLARQRLSGRPAAVIFLDLDRFRLVNDSMGHAIGDQLLRTVAFRLSELRTDRGLVARMGGDEFLLILSECKHYQEIQRFVAEVERTLRLPILFEETQVVPEASIGIAIFPDHGGESSELLRNADIAMSVAKSSGRANHQYFRPELSARAQEQLTLQSELHLALERQEFVLHYQPQFSKHGDFVGLEALIRWNHPARGLLFPGQFIQAAEEFGVIGDIGQWVLVEACRQNRAWQDAGEFFVPVAVNVSAAQFRRSSFFSDVNAALQGARLKPQHLEIEITESMVMESAERFTDALDHLQQIGTKTSLDDFGTGYSSLSFLRTFALDALKIDRMFVRDITTDSSAAVICETIIGMAHSLSMSVVAEGVESIEQANFLRKHDCDVLQGYYFSMPLAPMELVGEMPRLRTCFVEGVRRS
jgi:diguanylate cyclase (GGDEF)-like protein/PAS domain S-box-containing protein